MWILQIRAYPLGDSAASYIAVAFRARRINPIIPEQEPVFVVDQHVKVGAATRAIGVVGAKIWLGHAPCLSTYTSWGLLYGPARCMPIAAPPASIRGMQDTVDHFHAYLLSIFRTAAGVVDVFQGAAVVTLEGGFGGGLGEDWPLISALVH